jgi:hypothetical protein
MPEVGSARLLSFRDLQAMREEAHAAEEAHEAIRAERERERHERVARIRATRGDGTPGRRTRRRERRDREVTTGRATSTAPVGARRVFHAGPNGTTVELAWDAPLRPTDAYWSARVWQEARVTGSTGSYGVDTLSPERYALLRERVAPLGHPVRIAREHEAERQEAHREALRTWQRSWARVGATIPRERPAPNPTHPGSGYARRHVGAHVPGRCTSWVMHGTVPTAGAQPLPPNGDQSDTSALRALYGVDRATWRELRAKWESRLADDEA